MNCLITQYPVTRQYIERLSDKIGGPLRQVVVSTITAKGYFEIFKFFRNLKTESIYLPIVDPSGWPLAGLLQVLSMVVKANSRWIVSPDFTVHRFGFVDALAGSIKIVWATILRILTLGIVWWDMNRLRKVSRSPMIGYRSDRLVYLKTSLWLGVQAGGAVAHTAGVIEGFLTHGYAVDFASMEKPVALVSNQRLKVKTVAPRDTYVIPRELNHFHHNRAFIDAVTPLFNERHRFIYQRMSLGNFAGAVLSRRFGLPLVLEFNGSERWLARNWGTPLVFERLAMRSEEICLKHASLIVTVSDVLRQGLIERGIEPDRIIAVPNGVNTDVFNSDRFTASQSAALRKRYGISTDALVVAFVGTFGPWHGAEVLAKSVVDLVATASAWVERHKLHFMLIGDGARRPSVEAAVTDARIRKFVTIVGLIDQEQTPLHLAASDILVSPHVKNPDGSSFFGSPTKLFEYLAAGRPIIGSALNQIADVMAGCPYVGELERGEIPLATDACGILVRPEDTSEIVASIRFLVENPEWRMAAGRNARRRAVALHSWDRHVEGILDGIEKMEARSAAQLNKPLRLLFNGLHSKSGGGLTYLRNLLPLLAEERDIDVHLCVHKDQQDLLPEKLENITIHYLDIPPGFWRLQIHEQIHVPRLAKKIGADITFSPANYGPLMARNSIILLRNAMSVAFVERRPTKLAYWALVYCGTFLSLMLSRKGITVSEYARRSVGGGPIGVFDDRITVVPHGVSKAFSPPDDAHPRGNFLLAVSDIYVQKNLKNLICAVSLLKSTHPDISLLIAGRPVDAEYYDELIEIISEDELRGRVKFLGEVKQSSLVELYRSCRIFVFPSVVETFGNPLVEAMACGAPIASSETAAMPEVVGDAAEFFDPMDIEDMAAAIDRLLNDPVLCKRLSAKAIERAQNYSWEQTAARTLNIIRQAAIE